MSEIIENRFEILDLENAQEQAERRASQRDYRERRFKWIEAQGECEGHEGPCQCKDELGWHYPNTSYGWDRDINPYDNPNRKLYLCRNCGEAMEAYFADMWNDYYGW